MTADDIMAREAGMPIDDEHFVFQATRERVTKFAALVRAAALEEAAGVCENTLAHHYMKQVIPAHDEALLLAACADCAAAIRALKEQT